MKLFPKNKHNISIDFGSSEIKVIEGQAGKTGINIYKAESLYLPNNIYSDGKVLNEFLLKDLLEDFLRFNNFKMNLDAYGVINSSSIITREINIPKVEVHEIASLIQFQLEEYLPINPQDYVIDHLILENSQLIEGDKLRILLIAIPVEIVLGHLNLMKEVGLEPMVLDFQGNTISKLLSFNKTINGDMDTKDNTIVSIDLGYSKTEVNILINGNIEVSRAIDIGAKKIYGDISDILGTSEDEVEGQVKKLEDISNVEDDMDMGDRAKTSDLFRTSFEEIMDRANKVIKYYDSREFGNRIHFIVLQGGLSNICGIEKIVANYFNIPTIILNELDKVKLEGELWRYSNAMGALIRTDEVKR